MKSSVFGSSPKPEKDKKIKKEEKEGEKVKVSREDPNVLAISLGSLSSKANLMTGEPLFCKKCGASFSGKARYFKNSTIQIL
jgi:hypothetical protein